MTGRPPARRTGLRLHRDRLSVERLILALRAHPPAVGSAGRPSWIKALRQAEELRKALDGLVALEERAA